MLGGGVGAAGPLDPLASRSLTRSHWSGSSPESWFLTSYPSSLQTCRRSLVSTSSSRARAYTRVFSFFCKRDSNWSNASPTHTQLSLFWYLIILTDTRLKKRAKQHPSGYCFSSPGASEGGSFDGACSGWSAVSSPASTFSSADSLASTFSSAGSLASTFSATGASPLASTFAVGSEANKLSNACFADDSAGGRSMPANFACLASSRSLEIRSSSCSSISSACCSA